MSSRRTFIQKSIGLASAASLVSIASVAETLLTTKSSRIHKAPDNAPAPPQITILASDSKTGILTLSDKGNTKANRGDIITWVIGPKSGVSNITAIDMKEIEGNHNIFEDLPHQLRNSKNWQGRVDPSLPADITQEIYFISWMDNANPPVAHTFDPVIQVNA